MQPEDRASAFINTGKRAMLNKTLTVEEIVTKLKDNFDQVNRQTLEKVDLIEHQNLVRGQASDNFNDLLKCKEFEPTCFCSDLTYEVNCEICRSDNADKSQRKLSVQRIDGLLESVLNMLKCKASIPWTSNTLAHLVWKLACYGKSIDGDELKFLKASNLL